MTEESEIVDIAEDADVPTYPLYCHWTENEYLTYQSRVSKWENKSDWNYLASHEPMMPFVYKLAFKELLDQLESDKNSMSIEDVFEKYTGETDWN